MSERSANPEMASVAQPAPARRALLAGVGALAAVAGMGAAWWKLKGGEGAGGEPAPMLWALQCETPSGAPLAMSSLRGKPLLVNFWATWCPPCIEELPLVDGFFKQYAAKGWQVIGLAIDQPNAVRGFLQKTPVGFPIGVVGMAGTELVQSLGNIAGGLPFSIVLGADGLVRHRKMGKIDPADLQAWVAQS